MTYLRKRIVQKVLVFIDILPAGRTGVALLGATCFLMSASGLHAEVGAAAKPNILFILADDMRQDSIRALGAMSPGKKPLGNLPIETPHLDSLVREGFVFTRAVAAYPICHVSRAELLTGTTAFRNGLGYRSETIDPALATWAGTLRGSGYHTWYCGKWHNDGLPTTRGYEESRGLMSPGGAPPGSTVLPDHAGRASTGYPGWTFKGEGGRVELDKGIGLTPETDRHIADAAIEFIRQRRLGPFFLHVNFTTPHDPRIFPLGYERKYDPARVELPANFLPQPPFDPGTLSGRDELLLPKPLNVQELRAEIAAYCACVSHLDAQVGRLLAALRDAGTLQKTLVIFSSDQGLALGSHGLLGKQNLYEHTFRVPLIFSGPGVQRGARSDADCYLRDVFPTTCELAGVRIPKTVESRSLAALLNGGTQPVYDFVTGYYSGTHRALRRGDWKLIHYPPLAKTQLFNLREDPDELHDLSEIPAHRETMQGLQTQLDRWSDEHGDTFRQSPGGKRD